MMFVHTFVGIGGILRIVKPPNTLYIVFATPHKNEITSPKTDSVSCPFYFKQKTKNRKDVVYDIFEPYGYDQQEAYVYSEHESIVEKRIIF